MKPAVHEKCFLFTPGLFSSFPLQGTTCLQTYHTNSIGTKSIIEQEENMGKPFQSKPVVNLEKAEKANLMQKTFVFIMASTKFQKYFFLQNSRRSPNILKHSSKTYSPSILLEVHKLLRVVDRT